MYSPRRVEAVRARPVQAKDVFGGVEQPSFAPKPGLVAGFLQERESALLEYLDSFVQLACLEVDDDGRRNERRANDVHRKRCVAFGAFEPCVVRGIHDLLETEAAVELYRNSDVECGQRHLVQVHEARMEASRASACQVNLDTPTCQG